MGGRGGNAASALLDALMGSTRNLAPAVQAAMPRVERVWRDPEVCRLHLVGLCPHETFANTKFDLSSCPREHVDACRAVFADESVEVRLPVERAWLAFVEDRVLRPCDRRVAQGRDRVATSNREMGGGQSLAETEAELRKLSEHEDVRAIDARAADVAKNVAVLQMQIEEMKKSAAAAETPVPGDATTAAPSASSAPLPPAAAALQKLIDGLNGEKVDLDHKKNEVLKTLRAAAPPPPPAPVPTPMASSAHLPRNMRVCETCASLLRIDETEERLADHREGKVHASFAAVREKAREIVEQHQKWLADGVITEAQLRGPIPMPVFSDRPGAGGQAPPSTPYGRPPPQHYEQRHGGGDWHRGGGGGWRGGGYGGHHGYGGHGRDGHGYGPPPPQYEYGRPVAPRDGGRDDRRHRDGPSHSSHRSRRSRSRDRSHSRDRDRDRSRSSRHRHHSRSRSRSRDRHRSSRHRSRRSPSRSRSRSRSRDHKHRSHRSEKKTDEAKRDSRSRSHSKSKTTDAAPPTVTAATTRPEQTDTFTTPAL